MLAQGSRAIQRAIENTYFTEAERRRAEILVSVKGLPFEEQCTKLRAAGVRVPETNAEAAEAHVALGAQNRFPAPKEENLQILTMEMWMDGEIQASEHLFELMEDEREDNESLARIQRTLERPSRSSQLYTAPMQSPSFYNTTPTTSSPSAIPVGLAVGTRSTHLVPTSLLPGASLHRSQGQRNAPNNATVTFPAYPSPGSGSVAFPTRSAAELLGDEGDDSEDLPPGPANTFTSPSRPGGASASGAFTTTPSPAATTPSPAARQGRIVSGKFGLNSANPRRGGNSGTVYQYRSPTTVATAKATKLEGMGIDMLDNVSSLLRAAAAGTQTRYV